MRYLKTIHSENKNKFQYPNDMIFNYLNGSVRISFTDVIKYDYGKVVIVNWVLVARALESNFPHLRLKDEKVLRHIIDFYYLLIGVAVLFDAIASHCFSSLIKHFCRITIYKILIYTCNLKKHQQSRLRAKKSRDV